MSRVFAAEQTVPSTPSSGSQILWPDSTVKQYFSKDSTGKHYGSSFNASIAAQGAGFATDTYVTNSNILIPSFGVQAKTLFEWVISATKTAAGVATPAYIIRIGANGAIGDTARLTLTGPAQTAAIDAAVIKILAVIRAVSASVGVIQGTTSMIHNLAATGFANNAAGIVEATSAGFDNSALGGQHIGLSINAGASAAWTITQVRATAIW
jgi:hypothetical protein